MPCNRLCITVLDVCYLGGQVGIACDMNVTVMLLSLLQGEL